MKEILSTPRKKSGKKKSRLVVIEEDYVHPQKVEDKATLDSRIIGELDIAFREPLKALQLLINKKHKILALNIQALNQHQLMIQDIKKLNADLRALDLEMASIKELQNKDGVIALMKRKNNLLIEELLKVQKLDNWLDALEEEAYPNDICHERFFREYNDIISEVKELLKEYDSRKQVLHANTLCEPTLSKIDLLRADLSQHVIHIHKEVCTEYTKSDSVTSDQYARIISAKHNLDYIIIEMHQLFSEFDQQQQFENECRELHRKSGILHSVYHQLHSLSLDNPDVVLLKELKNILCNKDGSPKISNATQEFTPSLFDSKKSEDFKSKFTQIETTYHAVDFVIKKYQSHFDFAKDVKYLSERASVLHSLGYKCDLNIKTINQAIDYMFDKSHQTELNADLAQLLALNTLCNDIQIERNKMNQLISAWMEDVPELMIEGDCFIISQTEYPIIPEVLQYIQARKKILKAIQEGDEPDEQYEQVLALIHSSRIRFNNHVEIEDALLPQRTKVAHLINELRCVIKPIPLVAITRIMMNPLTETDAHFLNQFINLATAVNIINESLTYENIQKNKSLIANASQHFKELRKAYKQFKEGFAKIEQLRCIFELMLFELKEEHDKIIDETNSQDPRLFILAAIEDSLTTQLGVLVQLGNSLAELIHSENTQGQPEALMDQVNKEQQHSIGLLKEIIQQQQLKRLDRVQFNSMIAMIYKLTRPLVLFDTQEQPKLTGRFFSNNPVSEHQTNIRCNPY